MKEIAKLAYQDVNFIFILDHYDLHLEGTCRYNKRLSYFKTEIDDNLEPLFVRIFRLSVFGIIRQKIQQTLFEKCVGYHWTYPRNTQFYYRKPQFLYVLLFKLYYQVQRLFR